MEIIALGVLHNLAFNSPHALLLHDGGKVQPYLFDAFAQTFSS